MGSWKGARWGLQSCTPGAAGSETPPSGASVNRDVGSLSGGAGLTCAGFTRPLSFRLFCSACCPAARTTRGEIPCSAESARQGNHQHRHEDFYRQERDRPARLVRRRCRGQDPGPPRLRTRPPPARQAQARFHPARRYRRLPRGGQCREDRGDRQQAPGQDVLPVHRLRRQPEVRESSARRCSGIPSA